MEDKNHSDFSSPSDVGYDWRDDWESVREDFNLKNDYSDKYKKFAIDVYYSSPGLHDGLRHYEGRNRYSGPAVSVDNLDGLVEVIRATECPIQWDSLGYGYIVCPK